MGIRGLYTFINKVPGSFKNVNILEEIEKYRRQHGEDPVIVINLWTMANHFKPAVSDVIVGYRLNIIEKKFEKFLQRIANAGAEMLFTFKKTQTKEPDFKTLRQKEYNEALDLLSHLKTSGDFERLKQRHEYLSDRFEFPYNHSVMLVLCQVADRYGKLYGLDSINSRQSTLQAKLANDTKALALIGLNTHYIFYSGAWAFWSDGDLNMETMTIRQYNKELILKHLNVTTEKAALFSVLAGSLYSSEAIVNQILKFFQPWSKKLFANVAQFVNRQKFPLSDSAIGSIIFQILGQCSQQVFDDFKRTLQLMDPKTCNENTSKIDPEVMKYIKDDYANFAEEILENYPIYVSPVYLELSTNDVKIHELVIPLIQKTAGILLRHQPLGKSPNVFLKRSDFEGFTEMQIPQIVPQFQVPNLVKVVSGGMSYDEKMEILLWISGLKISVDDLKSCPDEYVVDAIICAYLVENKAMTAGEAHCMMTSIVNSKRIEEISDEYPSRIDSCAFKLGFLYQKLFYMLHSCIAAVGLKIFQTIIKFDGADFQRLYAKNRFITQPINSKILFAQLTSIASNAGNLKLSFNPSASQSSQSVLDEVTAGVKTITFVDQEAIKKLRGEIFQLHKNLKFEECLKKLEQALKIDGKCVELLCLNAECLIMLDKLKEAEKAIAKVLELNAFDIGVLYVQGLKEYYEGNFKESIKKFDEVVGIRADYKKAVPKRALAKKLLNFIYTGFAQSKNNNHDEAIKIFTSALGTDPSNRIFEFMMLFNRGLSLEKRGKFDEAFDDYSKALKINEDSAKALVRRANIHFKRKEFEDCIIDCEAALKVEASEGPRKLIATAKQSIETIPKRSCYEILGINQFASNGEIKKAYRKLSLQLHPDKAPSGATAVDKKKFERKFRDLKEAHDEAMTKRN